jgi:hypothetical protein
MYDAAKECECASCRTARREREAWDRGIHELAEAIALAAAPRAETVALTNVLTGLDLWNEEYAIHTAMEVLTVLVRMGWRKTP